MNEYRQMLVHLDDGARNVPRLRAARAIGADHGSAVMACYAVTSSYLEAAYGSEMAPALLTGLAEQERQRRDRARRAFDVEMREPGPAVTWCEARGLGIAGEFARQALCADLLVLGQDDPTGQAGTGGDFVETVIVASRKPALVVPASGWADAAGGNAVIAWKESPEAAHAVSAALPLLRRARRVHVLRWSAQPEASGEHRCLGLPAYLRAHGIEPVWHEGGEEPPALGELVMSRAFDLEADLLVMGCYGHSRARELVLGGMSRTVLRSMTLPVLMAH